MAYVEWQGKKPTVRYRLNGVKKRHSLPTGSSKREAERIARKIQTAIDNHGSWEPGGRAAVSLDDLVAEYKAHQEDIGHSQSTLRGYKVLDRFLAFAAGRASIAGVDQLRWQTVREFLMTEVRPQLDAKNERKLAKYRRAEDRYASYRRELQEFESGRTAKGPRLVRPPVKPRITPPGNTLNAYWRVIRAWWQWCFDEHEDDSLALRSPPRKAKLKLPQAVVPQVVAPSWGEIDAMIAQLEPAVRLRGRNKDTTALWRALVIQRYTGLRIGQATGLRWPNLVRSLLEDGVDHGPALNIGPALAKSLQEAESNRWIPVPTRLWRHFSEWRLADGEADAADRLIVGEPVRDPDSGHLVAGVGKDPAEAARDAWERAGVKPLKWQGHPTHAIRKRVRTHLERQLLGVEVEDADNHGKLIDRALDHQLGHSRNGVAARNYIDPFVYLPALRAAMEAIPTPEAVRTRKSG